MRKKSSSSSKHKKMSKEDKEANKEKRLLKLIGSVVVKCMSKHKDQMDHDQFKKYAKEVRSSLRWRCCGCSSPFASQLTHVIAEKEKKSSSYKEGRLDALSEEKTVKIKKFSKEYIAKVLRKLEKSGSRRKPVSTTASSSTPDSRADNDDSAEPNVDDIMDLDPNDEGDLHDSSSDDDDGDDHRNDRRADRAYGSGTPDDGVGSGQTSPTLVSSSSFPGVRHKSSNGRDDTSSLYASIYDALPIEARMQD